MAGDGGKTLGRDIYDPPGSSNTPLGTGPLLPFAGNEVPVSGNQQVLSGGGSAGKLTYYIENLPPLLDSLHFPMGASFMRFWQSQPGYVKDSTPVAKHRTRVLDHDNLKAWTHVSKHPFSSLSALRPWLSDEEFPKGRKKDLIDKILQRWNAGGHPPDSMVFPASIVSSPPPLTQKGPTGIPFSFPFSNDSAWANEVDFWGLFNPDSDGDGAGIPEFLASPFDDYGFALGKFPWFYMPKGGVLLHPATSSAPELLEVTITQLGIYAIDNYDFNGFQPLGIWDVDAGQVVAVPTSTAVVGVLLGPLAPLAAPLTISLVPDDAKYKPDLGWVAVTNGDFRKYRDIVGNGLDFVVYSDVKFFDVNGGSFLFERATGKPFKA
jgi:Family of unknown function (DUF6402)